MTQPADRLSAGLSADRFATYHACTGDEKKALALYEWNAAISAAFWIDLGHCEVLLRNCLHDRLTEWSTGAFNEPAWYRNPGKILRPKHLATIAEARRRATTGARGKPETPGRIVAELNFGFWRYLLASHYERSLWLPTLRYLFRNLSRRHVYSRLTQLNELRNRIAHHEPIYSQPLPQRHVELLEVLQWLNLPYRQWVEGNSRVKQVLAERPICTAIDFPDLQR